MKKKNSNLYACIDIGTNTTRLLIVEYINNLFHYKEDILKNDRLGENSLQDKILKKKSINRVLKTLSYYFEIIDKYKIYKKQIYIIGTSCIRDSINNNIFKQIIYQNYKIKLKILSGKKEAFFTSISLNNNKNKLIFDIGGGSTEIIFFKNKKIKFLNSLNLGAVRLFEKYKTKEFFNEKLLNDISFDINFLLEKKLKLLKNQISNENFQIYGIGGTVTTIAAILKKQITYQKEIIDNTYISNDFINTLLFSLKSLSLKEKKNIIGLEAKRADIIIYGIIILKNLLNFFNKTDINTSIKGIREGVIEYYFKNKKNNF